MLNQTPQKTKQNQQKQQSSYRKQSQNSNMNVYIRVRPLLSHIEDKQVWMVNSEHNTIENIIQVSEIVNSMMKKRYLEQDEKYKYYFDKIYDENSSTEKIYKEGLRQKCLKVLDKQNSTVFLYGQTTSGKTFTMIGDHDKPGLLPFCLLDLFEQVEKLRGKSLGYRLDFYINYMEIYNELINDLLDPGSVNLKIIEDSRFGVTAQNLKRFEVQCFKDALMAFRLGEEQRAYKETSIHDHSSRSHTIFQLWVIRTDLHTHKQYYNSLSLVDLAGSERMSNDDDNKCEETQYINKSLFALSNVIQRLAEGSSNISSLKHVPYRDSKLTRILQKCLESEANTVVICTVSPAALNFMQTMSTLRFAEKAKNIKIQRKQEIRQKSQQNIQDKYVHIYNKINQKDEKLKEQQLYINELQNQIQNQQQQQKQYQKEELSRMIFREMLKTVQIQPELY